MSIELLKKILSILKCFWKDAKLDETTFINEAEDSYGISVDDT